MNEQKQKFNPIRNSPLPKIRTTNRAKDNPNSEEALIVLKELTLNPRLTQRDLAEKIGISLGSTNYLVRELVKKGLVKMKSFSETDHKLKRISYILTPKGLKGKAELTLHFLNRKQQEYENLRREWKNLEWTVPKRRTVP